MDSKVEKFLLALPEPKLLLAEELRAIILGVFPEVTEAIRWNNLSFMYGKHDLAFIYTFKTVPYINFGFFRAVELDDPKGLFEGTGKGMRHIKIQTSKDIPVAQVKKWVKASIQLYKK
jgi:hypothetical protein